MKLAKNLERLGTETAFSVLAEAKKLEAQGKEMIHLGLGQPDFKTPQHIMDAAKKAIDDGRFGKIYSIQLSCFWNRNNDYYENSWKGTRNLDGGTLFTQFSHFIDLLYWMNGDVVDVESYTSNYKHQNIIDFEDTGVIILRFSNNSIGTINYTVNSFSKNMEGSLTIFGEKGTVKIGGQYLNELEYQDFENYKIENFNSKQIIYKIIFNSTPDKFLKIMENAKFKIDTSKDIWKLQ